MKRKLLLGCFWLGILTIAFGPVACYTGLRRSEENARSKVTAIYSRLREGDYAGLSAIASPHVIEKFKDLEQKYGRVVSFSIVEVDTKFPDTLWHAEVSVGRESVGPEFVAGSSGLAIHVVRTEQD